MANNLMDIRQKLLILTLLNALSFKRKLKHFSYYFVFYEN